MLAVLALSILVSPGATYAGNAPRINPMKIRLLQGTVVGTRTVPAYPYAIGALVNPVGEQRCLGLETEIKETSIFRVETASQYFDLLKWCNGYGTPYSWRRWEHLNMNEPVVFRVVRAPVQLSIRRCEKLGLLTKAQAQQAFNFLSQSGQKVYESHCRYSVTEAYIKSPNKRWIFRVINSGLRSLAKNVQIGASYSASLAPP